MGSVCAEHLPPPDLVLVSPSVRTRETIERFLEAWNSVAPKILVIDRLYLAGRGDWSEIITSCGSHVDHVLACGHQPGMGDLAAWLCTEFPGDVPTTAVISFILPKGNLEVNTAVLDFFARPRDFK